MRHRVITRGGAVGLLALLAGCHVFGGTAGVTLDSRQRAGVSLELRAGPMTMLGKRGAVQYIMAPSIGYDGDLMFGATFGLAFVRLPDKDPDHGYEDFDDAQPDGDDEGRARDDAAYRVGVSGGSTEIARRGPNDSSTQLGIHLAYLPKVNLDEPRQGWTSYGIALDAAARWSYLEGRDGVTLQPLGGGDEPTDWWIRVGVIMDAAEDVR